MEETSFGGDKKVGESLFTRPEKAFVAWGVPKIPACVETYHLTLSTLLWSWMNIVFGYLASSDIRWLWGVSLMIVLQYLTDLFDGAVGRTRGTGLIKWGFYMDHFLDYVFLASLVFAGYLISPDGLQLWYVFLLIILGCFMVNSFLSFAATNRFEIYIHGLGPTELRLVFILINTLLVCTGTWHLRYTLPLACLIALSALVYLVIRTHKNLWELDMQALRGPRSGK